MRYSGMALGVLEVLLPGKQLDGSRLVEELVDDPCCSREQLQLQPAVSVPAFFTCPISLDLMSDPVTLSTGMTYDRASIEQWLGDGHNTCPATNQVLVTQDLIPNHTLRRLIQDWCVTNSEVSGVERIPTPRKAAVEQAQQHLRRLVNRIAQGFLMDGSLKKLWSLAKEGAGEKNRKCLVEAGAVTILAGALGELGMDITNKCSSSNRDLIAACEDGLATIALVLPLAAESDKKALAASRPMAALCWVLSLGSTDAKINAAEVIQSVLAADNNLKAVVGCAAAPGAIQGLVSLLKQNQMYPRAVHASLKCLLSLCIPKKNRLAAIDADAIGALIQLLPAETERGNIGHAFALLEVLASCAEGREAISNLESLAIPMIVKSMVGISELATEHAVAALWAIISFSSNRSVLHTALQAGAFTKLLMLLPSECSLRSKLKAREILKLLNPDHWSCCNNPCRPTGSRHEMKSCVAVTSMV
ncbi:unnamed protein product [Sphagnum jensenii]|uniref:RING-type E3 ubiquitin transferase n=1 Tax=Sphagnum jensenii TaxID=128206 RepID=A0ABP0XIX5_9BRYO